MAVNAISNPVVLDRGDQTACSIVLHGATIVSWTVKGEEQLFVGKNAAFDDETPIMGGVPIVFPRFADWGDKPFHGFARVCRWSLEKKPEILTNGDVKVVLKMSSTEWTRQFWDYEFSLLYEVTLTEFGLQTDLTVHNTGTVQFNFNLLLHTYFKLPDVTECEISGFKGCQYTDKTLNFHQFTQESDLITVRKHTDNIYNNTAAEHVISNFAGGKKMLLKKSNYPDTVVWNPWSDTVTNFPDLDQNEYRRFFCVEAGNVVDLVPLAPGEQFIASQILQIV